MEVLSLEHRELESYDRLAYMEKNVKIGRATYIYVDDTGEENCCTDLLLLPGSYLRH